MKCRHRCWLHNLNLNLSHGDPHHNPNFSCAAAKRVESRPDLLQANGMPAEAEPAPSPARVPEVDPIDAAAHLQLLGESLSVIGCRLQETEVSALREDSTMTVVD